MGGFLSNFGLTAQGMDQSRQINQNYDIGTEQLEGAKQGNTLRSQQVEAGRMGLEDAQRTRTNDANLRSAATRGGQGGAGITGSLDEMALAAEQAGDIQKALGFRHLKSKLKEEGIANVVHAALIDPRPGPRPDLAQVFNQYGIRKDLDPNSVTLDEKGMLSFKGPDGQTSSFSIGQTAERLGMVKPPEMKTLAPGAMGIITQPGQPMRTIRNDPREAKKGFEMGKITNNGTEYAVSFNKDTGDANVLNPDGTPVPGHTSVHTDSTGRTIVTIDGKLFDMVPGTPGTPGQKNWFSPDVAATPATPARLNPIEQAEAPPIAGAQKSPKDGKWYVKQGDKWAPVIVNGAPNAAPAQATQKPTPSPAPTTTPVADTQNDIPEVSQPAERKTPAQKRDAFAARRKGEKDAAGKERILKAFRDLAKLPRMTADDAPVIEDALKSGLLNPAETDKANRMLNRLKPQTAGYKSGGKVQRHGLG